MSSCSHDSLFQRSVRRKICCRLTCHWLLFLGVAVVLTAVLEFLFGEPRQPSVALLGEALRKHAVLFAALLALIPISLRDCVKCIDRVVFSKTPTEHPTGSVVDTTVGPATASNVADAPELEQHHRTESHRESRSAATASV